MRAHQAVYRPWWRLCAEVCGGLFAAQGDALEAFELSDGLFDAGASPYGPLRRIVQAGIPGHAGDDGQRPVVLDPGYFS